MSIYKLKRVKLAEGAYQNVNATSKGDKKNAHTITVQIDDAHEEVFVQICDQILQGVEASKQDLGWSDDAVVKLPFDVEAKTLQLRWNEKRHIERCRFWILEPGADEPIQLQHDQLPNISGGSEVSLGLYVNVSSSPATDKYKERIWINVEPEVLYITSVEAWKPKDLYNVDDLEQQVLTDGDF